MLCLRIQRGGVSEEIIDCVTVDSKQGKLDLCISYGVHCKLQKKCLK